MGQNFLSDPNVAAMIVGRCEFAPDDTVLEIGAGLGALTVPLAGKVKRVLAVEPDKRIAAILGNELLAAGAHNVTIIEKDILRCDIETLAGASDTHLKVVGNLPYHISSQVLIRLINSRKWIDGAALMFQKEVAERILANPGTKTYGKLSVLIQYCARIRLLAQVSASSFFPKPKVDSQVVGIAFYSQLPFRAPDEPLLFRLVHAAFGKRRKTLKNALLSSDLGFEEQRISSALELAGIDPRRRAETLSVKEFVTLATMLKKE
ncbi:MAG: ribosomal RNA small subunit methyltransferase A [Desulfobacterales bacterium]|nr:ribosomal RNA small subunit methyltransferase A [Desulfobacterales bacterium]